MSDAISPFASAGVAMIALGYSAIPIRPGEKYPGLYAGAEWRHQKGWNRFCNELPTNFQAKLWAGWPDAGLGVACGRGLIAFDIDRDELVLPIKAVLPPAVVAKKGRKGETLFYRGDTDAIRSRGFKIDGLGVMDLISHGKQTVLPPSLHPTTGLPYVWTTQQTLADTPLADLNEVTSADLDRVIEVLNAHGYEPEKDVKPWDGEIVESGDDQARDFFRKLNEDALANLDAWVPRLGFQRAVRSGGGWRTVAEWRPSNSGNPLHKRPLLLSINPKGIVDYGDGDKTYTAINVVMRMHDLSDWQIDKAAVWLGEKLGYDFSPQIVLKQSKPKAAPEPPKPAPSPSALTISTYVELPEAATGREVAASFAGLKNLPAVQPEPEALKVESYRPSRLDPKAERQRELHALTLEVPGLVGDLVSWIDASAQNPNRILALAASLALVGTLAGRNYASPTDLRTNIYSIGLAPSGFGKDHARDCVLHLLTKSGLTRFLGAAKIMSASGMRKRFEAQAAILWMLDEFGGFMRQISDKRNPHLFAVRDYLLELSGRAATQFLGADYAGEVGTPVHNPNVCIYGTSTPADYWGALTGLSAVDGLLARFVVFNVGGEIPEDVEPTASKSKPPQPLIDACRSLTLPKVGGNMNGRNHGGELPVTPLVVPWAKGAKEEWLRIKKHYIQLSNAANGETQPFWNRAAEHAQRIALIIAVGINPESPEIDAEWLRLGQRIADVCIRETLAEISGRLADNDRQREHLDVRRWIMEAGPKGLTRTELSRKVNGRFNAKRTQEICESLDVAEKIITSVIPEDGGAGRKAARWIARRFLTQGELESEEE